MSKTIHYGFVVIALIAVLVVRVPSQQHTQNGKGAKSAVTASNFRWTTYTNGWADLSYSLRNNTDVDIHNVKYRVIFYGAKGEPIHYEEPYQGAREIPAHLAVTETVTLMEGGLNIYHSTVSLRVQILSYDNTPSGENKPDPDRNR